MTPPAPRLHAAGQPLDEAVADAAAEWLTRFMAGEVDAGERRRWQQWRAAHPDHERAWQHIERVSASWQGLPPGLAYRTLAPLAGRPARPGRRQLLAALFGVGLASGLGLAASRSTPLRALHADLRTATGEQRRIELADGSLLTLNTASAVDIRFDGEQRLVRLIAGEIHVVTGHDARFAGQPFVVATDDGRVRALGTRFAVARDDAGSRVDVFAHAVEISPAGRPERTRIVGAGEGARFDADDSRASALDPRPEQWAAGQLHADDVRLDDFLAELGRYRSGILRCDPAVAGLRFSGVFPLADSDRILAMLPNSLPVQVRFRTRYWVTVSTVDAR